MPVEYKSADNIDYNIYRAINSMYTSANCIIKNYLNKDNLFEANEIIDGIYLGNINSVYDIKKLKELGITHIISVLSGFIPPYPEDFDYLVINAYDTENTNLLKTFETANKFIDETLYENNGKVLIHCMAGRSRSATILAAFIIKNFGMDVKNSIESIKIKRNIVEPNKSFLNQLNIYYREYYNHS